MHPGVLEVVQIRPTAEDVRVEVGLHLQVHLAARMLPSSAVKEIRGSGIYRVFLQTNLVAHEFPSFNGICDKTLHRRDKSISGG